MDTNTLEDFRHQFCTKYGLSAESWHAASQYLNHVFYEKDAHLLQAGQVTKQLHLMLSGLVRFYYVTEEGKFFNKSFASVGSVISSVVSLVEGKAPPFSVAERGCHLIYFYCLG